jgi:hypothetical protein
MHLKLTLTLCLLILIINTNYCQYPIVKKIGNDSIILMTLKQGEQINKLYEVNKNEIDSLKRLVNNTIKVNDSILLVSDSIKNILTKRANEYRFRYEERLNIPVQYKYHDNKWDFIQKLVLISVIVLQFFTIKR